MGGCCARFKNVVDENVKLQTEVIYVLNIYLLSI